jgi:hypothetical protein
MASALRPEMHDGIDDHFVPMGCNKLNSVWASSSVQGFTTSRRALEEVITLLEERRPFNRRGKRYVVRSIAEEMVTRMLRRTNSDRKVRVCGAEHLVDCESCEWSVPSTMHSEVLGLGGGATNILCSPSWSPRERKSRIRRWMFFFSCGTVAPFTALVPICALFQEVIATRALVAQHFCGPGSSTSTLKQALDGGDF